MSWAWLVFERHFLNKFFRNEQFFPFFRQILDKKMKKTGLEQIGGARIFWKLKIVGQMGYTVVSFKSEPKKRFADK